MKKLILTSASVAALAIAAPAVAQTNGSTVLQSGANQTATVAQDGANSESLVEQSNANNVANVQIGRAQVSTPVTNEPLVSRLLLEKNILIQKHQNTHNTESHLWCMYTICSHNNKSTRTE